MKAQQIVMIGLLALVSFSANAQSKGVLDGKTFKIKAWDSSQSDLKTPEELVFKDGRVDAPVCHEYGFFASKYQTTEEEGKVKFTFMNESEYEGDLYFIGYVEGDRIEGTYIWRKDGRADLKYEFEGTLN